jgi:hypothetical protein
MRHGWQRDMLALHAGAPSGECADRCRPAQAIAAAGLRWLDGLVPLAVGEGVLRAL